MSAVGEMILPQEQGKPQRSQVAPDGPFVVLGFFGQFARLRNVNDPEDTDRFFGWPADQIVKH